MDDPIQIQFERLEKKISKTNSSANIGRIREAYEFARASHGEQKRKDGSPFVSHPLAAAEILAE
ncbi:MAG: hypothetical protein IJD20_05550, partial [Oscillospiraceae bacterium]|nr:hypothetical protein [Oscillospiraceae bacterium]